MQQKLTKRQQEVYEFIREKIQTRGYGPTVREISGEFGIKSPNGVICHLKALEKKGLISRKPHQSRAIELVEGPSRKLPMLGKISAGRLETTQQRFQVDLNQFFQNRDCFLLEISGNSMIDAHITDGDLVIVEPRDCALNGEMVVTETASGAPTVKIWYQEGELIRLQPANRKLATTWVRKAKVNGVVVGLIRKCDQTPGRLAPETAKRF